MTVRGPLVVLVLVVLAGAASWGLLREEASEPEAAATPVQLDVGEVLDLTPGCRRDLCTVLERRDGFHFDGRNVALLAVAHPEACEDGRRTSLHLAAGQEVFWSSETALCGDAVSGVETDATGHAFLVFAGEGNAGTVVVLRVDGDAVEDFGSLDGRYTGHPVGVADEDGDGANEIKVGERTWKWTGSSYE